MSVEGADTCRFHPTTALLFPPHYDFDRGPASRRAPYVELRADHSRPLLHPFKSEMSGLSRRRLKIEAYSVILYREV